ncbi:MAG: O-antigen ligase family protein [Flavobacteriales bacterium]|nr:O-antigen ligase family protein [Flavobacteriales bacterium]
MSKIITNLQTFFFVLLGIAIPTSIAANGIIMGVLTLLWVLQAGFIQKKKNIISSKWMLSILGLLIFYTLALFWGDNHNNISWIFQKLPLLLMFIVLATSNFKQKAFRFGAVAFLITTFISALLAIAIDLEIIQELHNYTSLISLNNDHKSAIIKYNYHNLLLAFSALLSFYLLIEKKTKYPVILLVFIIVYGWSIFSEAGRAGHLVFILFFILYSAYYIKEKAMIILGVLGLLSAMLIGAYQFSHPFKVRIDEGLEVVLNNGKRPGKIKDIRYVFVQESINFIKEKPIFGHGTGSFGTIFNREVKSGHKFYTHTTPHNNYLYILFELGFIGLLLLLSIFYFQIRELLVLKDGVHRLVLPLMFMIIMLVDSYFFIFILTTFYIYFYTIYRGISLDKPS